MNKVIETDLNIEYTEYKPEKVYMPHRPDGTRNFDGEFYCKNATTAIRQFCKLVPECQYIYDESKEYGAFTSNSPFAHIQTMMNKEIAVCEWQDSHHIP